MFELLESGGSDFLLAALVVAAALPLPWMFRQAFGRRGPRVSTAVRDDEDASSASAEAVDVLALDGRRRLVLLRDRQAERLVLIGGPNDLVIEPHIGLGAARDAKAPAVRPEREASRAEASESGKESASADLAGLFPLGLLSLAAGVGVGVLCGAFRLALDQADRFRAAIPEWLEGRPGLGCASLILGAAAAAGFSAWLVRRFVPAAAGSGIPHVESVIGGEAPPARLLLLPVKFVGGLLAIGAGMALGREGPSVQMGATLAHHMGRLFRCDWRDSQSLLAAGAGAGLAAAFNAPLAGAVFVLEELLRRFDMRHATAALGASVGAIAVVRLIDGPTPELSVSAYFNVTPIDTLLCLALGVAAGLAGAAYNGAILGALDMADRLSRWPAEWRAALVGASVGALAWFAPGLVGGGDALTQLTLDGAFAFAILPLVFLLRFILGAACYAAGTPGGLFAPLLVLGAQLGYVFGSALYANAPDAHMRAAMFAIIGMAAFFAAVVRAPLTGMILITEMTESSELLLPMLAASFSAMATAALLRNEPIYDALKERSARLASREPG